MPGCSNPEGYPVWHRSSREGRSETEHPVLFRPWFPCSECWWHRIHFSHRKIPCQLHKSPVHSGGWNGSRKPVFVNCSCCTKSKFSVHAPAGWVNPGRIRTAAASVRQSRWFPEIPEIWFRPSDKNTVRWKWCRKNCLNCRPPEVLSGTWYDRSCKFPFHYSNKISDFQALNPSGLRTWFRRGVPFPTGPTHLRNPEFWWFRRIHSDRGCFPGV